MLPVPSAFFATHPSQTAYIQWPFQEPKLEVPTIWPMVQGYVREYPHKIWPYVVQYLHFRILEFPLIYWFLWIDQQNLGVELDTWTIQDSDGHGQRVQGSKNMLHGYLETTLVRPKLEYQKKMQKNNAAMMCNYIIQTSSTVVLTFLPLTTTSPQCWSCFNAVVALAISGLPSDPLAVAGVNNRNTIGKKGLSPRNMGI